MSIWHNRCSLDVNLKPHVCMFAHTHTHMHTYITHTHTHTHTLTLHTHYTRTHTYTTHTLHTHTHLHYTHTTHAHTHTLHTVLHQSTRSLCDTLGDLYDPEWEGVSKYKDTMEV